MKQYVILLLLLPALCFADSGRILDDSDDPYYIDTVYDGNDLRDIQFVQSNDVMYMVHGGYAPQKLTRYDHNDWTIGDVNWEGGPFLDENTDKDITIYADANTGDVNIVASSEIFDDDHVGALWRISHVVPQDSLRVRINAELNNVLFHDYANPSPYWVDSPNSPVIYVAEGREYDFITTATWYGTITLQRSYDEKVTWEDAYSYTSEASGNIQYAGREENDNAWYRIYYAAVASGEGIMNVTLNLRSYTHDGIVTITSVTDANHITATVDSDYPLAAVDANTPTYRWAEGAWSDYRGHPRAICFYQNRLCLAGTAYEPTRLWCSQSADYENMDVGTRLDNEAIVYDVGAAKQNPIMWLQDGKGILVGTTGNVIRIGTPSSKYVMTPSTISSDRQTETGSCATQAGLVGNSIVYIDRNRRKVWDLVYDIQSDAMVSPDLTLYADDISEPNLVEMAWQERPDTIGWFVKGDGNMVTLTYIPEQGVAAWSEIATDGNFVSVCCIPGEDEDEVWVAVDRDCNDYILIEKFHSQDWSSDMWFVDSGLEYSGQATATITGLSHLNDESVQVYSDANGYLGDFTVSSGSITLDATETQCIAGLGYTSELQTFPIEISSGGNSSVGINKNIREIVLCLYQSIEGRYGFEDMWDIPYPSYTEDYYTGQVKADLMSGYDNEVYIIIDQNEPYPLGITGISFTKFEVYSDN